MSHTILEGRKQERELEEEGGRGSGHPGGSMHGRGGCDCSTN